MKDGIELIEHYFPHLNAGQKDQFSSLGKIYGDWNAKINVISRKDKYDGIEIEVEGDVKTVVKIENLINK